VNEDLNTKIAAAFGGTSQGRPREEAPRAPESSRQCGCCGRRVDLRRTLYLKLRPDGSGGTPWCTRCADDLLRKAGLIRIPGGIAPGGANGEGRP